MYHHDYFINNYQPNQYPMLRTTARILRNFSLFKHTKKININPLKAAFSSNTSSNTPSNMQMVLKQEIQYQKENSPSSETLLNSIRKQGWEIESQGVQIQIKKVVGDKTILAVFYIEPPHAIQQQGEQQQWDKSFDKEGNFGQYVEFTVYIKKLNSKKVLYGDFLCNDEEIRLVNLNFTEDYNNHKLLQKHSRPLSMYQGPDIYSMDSNLLLLINDYFDQLGINKELVSFIQEYSKNSEHPFYVEWLEDLDQFIK